MVVNGLITLGIVLFGLGVVMLYCAMWCVLLFMLWENITDEDYAWTFVFGAVFIMWTGIGILCVAPLI